MWVNTAPTASDREAIASQRTRAGPAAALRRMSACRPPSDPAQAASTASPSRTGFALVHQRPHTARSSCGAPDWVQKPRRGADEKPALDRWASGLHQALGDELLRRQRQREVVGDPVAGPRIDLHVIGNFQRSCSDRACGADGRGGQAVVSVARLPACLRVQFELVDAVSAARNDDMRRGAVLEVLQRVCGVRQVVGDGDIGVAEVSAQAALGAGRRLPAYPDLAADRRAMAGI